MGPKVVQNLEKKFRFVFPYTGLLRFLLSPKTQIMSYNKLRVALKMPHCCLNLPCGHMLPWQWVVFRVVTEKLATYWALCASCAQTPPTGYPGMCSRPALSRFWGYLHSILVCGYVQCRCIFSPKFPLSLLGASFLCHCDACLCVCVCVFHVFLCSECACEIGKSKPAKHGTGNGNLLLGRHSFVWPTPKVIAIVKSQFHTLWDVLPQGMKPPLAVMHKRLQLPGSFLGMLQCGSSVWSVLHPHLCHFHHGPPVSA